MIPKKPIAKRKKGANDRKGLMVINVLQEEREHHKTVFIFKVLENCAPDSFSFVGSKQLRQKEKNANSILREFVGLDHSHALVMVLTFQEPLKKHPCFCKLVRMIRESLLQSHLRHVLAIEKFHPWTTMAGWPKLGRMQLFQKFIMHIVLIVVKRLQKKHPLKAGFVLKFPLVEQIENLGVQILLQQLGKHVKESLFGKVCRPVCSFRKMLNHGISIKNSCSFG